MQKVDNVYPIGGSSQDNDVPSFPAETESLGMSLAAQKHLTRPRMRRLAAAKG